MIHAHTITDVKKLFHDFDFNVERKYNTVIITFSDRDDDLPKSRSAPLPPVGNGSFDDGSGVNFNRATRNAVRGLCETPRFWRLTTTAAQLWHFYCHGDGKSFGITKVRKSGGNPLTLSCTTV